MEGYESLLMYVAVSILLLPWFLVYLVIKPILNLSKPLSHISWPDDSQFIDQTPVNLQQLIANYGTELRVHSFKKEKERVKCIVCLCKMKEGDDTRELKCRHVFHKDCLDRWVEFKHVVCPLCQVPLVTIEAKTNITATTVYRLIGDWCF